MIVKIDFHYPCFMDWTFRCRELSTQWFGSAILPVSIWYIADRLNSYGYISLNTDFLADLTIFMTIPVYYSYEMLAPRWHTSHVFCSLCHTAWESLSLDVHKEQTRYFSFWKQAITQSACITRIILSILRLSWQIMKFQISNHLDKANSCTLFPKMTITSKLYIYILYSFLFFLFCGLNKDVTVGSCVWTLGPRWWSCLRKVRR